MNTAAAALRRSVELSPPGTVHDLASERLVDALVLAGRVDDAIAAGQPLAQRLPGLHAAAVHLRLAEAAATAARWRLAGEHLSAAAALLGETDPPRSHAELALRDAELALGTNELKRAERRARDALALARTANAHEQECEALQLLGRCSRRTDLRVAERWFREALTIAESSGLGLWRLRAMHELGTIALLDRSQVAELLEAQRLAETLGAMATATVLDIEIAAGYAGLDELDAARRHGEQAVRRGSELGLDLIVAYGWLHVTVASTLGGDEERAAAARAAALAAAPGNRDIEGLLLGAPLFAALVADDLPAALEIATRMTELLRGSSTAPPAHHRAAWPVLLALAGRPEATAAIEEIRQEIAVSRGGRGWLGLARAILTGRGDPEGAAALAVAADADLTYMPMWRSLARRVAAQAAEADGWAIPDGWLAQAEACLRRLGHRAAADACRRLRGREAPVPPAWSRRGITRREADVLALLIEGRSNREIADTLYLSVRTVEKHVESLLRKTSTKTRTQLARAAAPT